MQCESLSSVADAPMSDLMSALKSVFGFSTFRPHQEEIVRALLGRRDLFAVGQGTDLLPSRGRA